MEQIKNTNQKIKVTDEDVKNAENIVETVSLGVKLWGIVKGLFVKTKSKKK
ncbi:MAG: hypothetical protein K1X86_15425 [Ignavibacteria bacterium]|nr:hypothetical protein [Ignavibacteria bacterium]